MLNSTTVSDSKTVLTDSPAPALERILSPEDAIAGNCQLEGIQDDEWAESETFSSSQPAAFDSDCERYRAELHQGLKFSGESADYFASRRASITSQLVAKFTSRCTTKILDYGCGIGTAARPLLTAFPEAGLVGFDIATDATRRAATTHDDLNATWTNTMHDLLSNSIDVIYCNGVFHHIPVMQRNECLSEIARVLKPGGVICLWENNPWNPGTRWIMRQIPFDRDAICLSSFETKARIRRAGLIVRRTEFHFYFPHILRACRGMEPLLTQLPLGGQYVVCAQKAE